MGCQFGGSFMENSTTNTAISANCVRGKQARVLQVSRECDQHRVKQISLRPQQRFLRPLTSDCALVVVCDGLFALDAAVGKGQRQILDFLISGDFVELSTLQLSRSISVRAITAGTLAPAASWTDAASLLSLDQMTMNAKVAAQLQRAYFQQMLVRQLDSEARTASFLVSYAMRSAGGARPEQPISFPISREDLADHLAINRDTLSRVMMRFETLELIKRIDRHTLRVIDFDRLVALSPVASQILAVFGKRMSVASERPK